MSRLVCTLVSMAFVFLNAKVDARTAVLDDFQSADSIKRWTPAEGATIQIENGALRIDYPKYIPGDPNGWPRGTRDMSDVYLAEYNGMRIDLSNPTNTEQHLQLGFRDRQGVQGQRVYLLKAGERRIIDAPFNATLFSASVNWSGTDLMDFMKTHPAYPMTWIVHRIELYADRPAETMAGRVQSLLNEIARVTPTLRGAAGWTADLQTQTGQTVESARKLLKDKGDIQNAQTSLLSITSLLKTIQQSAATDQTLLVWTVPIGTPIRPSEAMIQFATPAESLPIHTAQGQYEEGLVRLTNLTNTAQDLRITLASENTDLLDALSIRRNQPVLARDRSVIGDALVPLDQAGTVAVAPYETVELWVRVDAKHRPLPAGSHQAELRVVDLRRGATSVQTLPIAITVWNFDLQSQPQRLQVQVWAAFNEGRSFVIHNKQDQALADMLDYGVNVVDIYPNQIPWPKLTPDGELAGPIDYTRHDNKIDFIFSQGAKPFILMYMNMDDNNDFNWRLRTELKAETPEWERGLENWLRDWTTHLSQRGLTTADYAFYLTDEPGETELERYITFGNIARKIDPSIQIYINGASVFDTKEMTDRLMAVTDIWQPDETVGFVSNPELLPLLRSYPNQTIWVYACKTAMRMRSANAHDYYRLMTWRALRDGVDGIGYWAYAAAASDQEDPWDETGVPGSGALLIYPGKDGLLASVRWELVRTAIDDSRYVELLRAAADAAPSTDARDALLPLIGERLTEVIANPDNPAMATQWRIDAGNALEKCYQAAVQN